MLGTSFGELLIIGFVLLVVFGIPAVAVVLVLTRQKKK